MSFKGVFITVFLGMALVVAAFMLNARRPRSDVAQPTAAFVRATGKCAECHREQTSAVVHEYESSRHSASGVTCLDCHRPVDGQKSLDHKGFVIATGLSSANCKQCHPTEYDQYLRSRHAAPAWAAVTGPADFTAEQVAHAETFHPGAVKREANPLAAREGPAAINKGCLKCHDVGRPNPDGSVGTCTNCHARHAASVELARNPETCGQCHMGPDHSQIEIYHESKHGVLFNAQKTHFNLSAPAKRLTTRDMPVPTCSTCHMSGLEGQKLTHDVTERLSYFLFAATSEKRPTYQQGQINMKETCLKCHTRPRVDKFYEEAESVVASTNNYVKQADDLIKALREEKLLTPDPFDEPIEYTHFDLWHYFGRTAKHGAFMGGADFVQWHGFYELNVRLVELKRQAAELRAAAREGGGAKDTDKDKGKDKVGGAGRDDRPSTRTE